MSQENVQVVRKPLRLRGEGSSRAFEHQLALRFPRLGDTYARLIGMLPPRTRLRQAAVWRGIRLSVEAFNRRDLDAALVSFHSDFELHPAREFVDAGLFEPCYRGRVSFRKYVSDWSEVWGGDLRVEPVELIDLGDRLVGLGEVPQRAQASGVALTNSFAAVLTLKHGKVIREHDYLDHAEALEAAGLRE